MKNSTWMAALAMTAVVLGAAADIAVSAPPANLPREPMSAVRPPKPAALQRRPQPAPLIPEPEPSLAASPNAGFAPASVFSAASSAAVTPNASTLSGPVTLTYSGSVPAFTLTATGTGKGLSAAVANAGSGSSALYGQTVGSGAGLTGYNLGTGGPGGKFEVTNENSYQAGAFASTSGLASALLATVTNKNSNAPAIFGENIASTNFGVGVEGEGYYEGVEGYVPYNTTAGGQTAGLAGYNDSNGWGVYASSSSNGTAVGGYAESGYGVFAYSQLNDAVYASTTSGNAAVYADNEAVATFGNSYYGVKAQVQNGTAIAGFVSNTNTGQDGVYGTGVYGRSVNGIGVDGEDDGSGVGIYGVSATGYAGEFFGNAIITGELSVGSIVYTSDRDLKSGIRPIDGKDLLARLSQLKISSWHYTSAPTKRHVGPMAQDFHAAFGLNGEDDKHISAVDIGGVSLAAIQELGSQMKLKDAEIAELKAQVAAQTEAMARMQQSFSARMTALEQQSVARTQNVALEVPAKQRVD